MAPGGNQPGLGSASQVLLETSTVAVDTSCHQLRSVSSLVVATVFSHLEEGNLTLDVCRPPLATVQLKNGLRTRSRNSTAVPRMQSILFFAATTSGILKPNTDSKLRAHLKHSLPAWLWILS